MNGLFLVPPLFGIMYCLIRIVNALEKIANKKDGEA